MYLLHKKSFPDCKTNKDKMIHQQELDKIHSKLYEMINYNCMLITIEGHFSLYDEDDKPIMNAPMKKLFDFIYSNQYNGIDYACYNDVLVMMMYKLLDDNSYARTQIVILPYAYNEDNDKIIMTIGNQFSTSYERIKEQYLSNQI